MFRSMANRAVVSKASWVKKIYSMNREHLAVCLYGAFRGSVRTRTSCSTPAHECSPQAEIGPQIQNQTVLNHIRRFTIVNSSVSFSAHISRRIPDICSKTNRGTDQKFRNYILHANKRTAAINRMSDVSIWMYLKMR